MYKIAADQGNAEAQFYLAQLYMKGEGVPRDDKQAAKWYRFAADQGVALAQYNLGIYYEQGTGVRKDIGEAVRWYRRAAEQDCVEACMNLGICYMNGLGVMRNPAEGGSWFQKVSDLQKTSPGAYQHIMMTPETIETARLCHQRAETGDPEAQHSLYWIYKLGMGVSQNDQEAQKWFSRAATSQRTHR